MSGTKASPEERAVIGERMNVFRRYMDARDRLIVTALEAGFTTVSVAQRMGIARSTVHRAQKRAKNAPTSTETTS